MPTDRTKSLIRRLFDEAFNQGNLAMVDELLSPDQLVHNAYGGTPNGPQGLKLLLAMLRTAFPDLHCTVEDEIREGEKSAAHWTMRGTHKGLYLGNPQTDKSVVVQGIIFARVEEGKIVEYQMLFDQFGLLQQLEIIPR